MGFLIPNLHIIFSIMILDTHILYHVIIIHLCHLETQTLTPSYVHLSYKWGHLLCPGGVPPHIRRKAHVASFGEEIAMGQNVTTQKPVGLSENDD